MSRFKNERYTTDLGNTSGMKGTVMLTMFKNVDDPRAMFMNIYPGSSLYDYSLTEKKAFAIALVFENGQKISEDKRKKIEILLNRCLLDNINSSFGYNNVYSVMESGDNTSEGFNVSSYAIYECDSKEAFNNDEKETLANIADNFRFRLNSVGLKTVETKKTSPKTWVYTNHIENNTTITNMWSNKALNISSDISMDDYMDNIGKDMLSYFISNIIDEYHSIDILVRYRNDNYGNVTALGVVTYVDIDDNEQNEVILFEKGKLSLK